MVAYRLQGFAGIVPRLTPRLLGDNQAQVASNCVLSDGTLTPLKAPLAVYDPQRTGLQTLYRISSGGSAYWLTFANEVSLARGPVAGDTSGRLYYTGEGEPRVTNTALATTGGAPYPHACYVLGLPAPVTAPTVTPAGGSGAAASRVYRYTFVAKTGSLDEEGPPSPASSVVTGKVDDTWALSALDTAPANSAGISALTYVGSVVTVTSAATHWLRVGERVTLAGINTVAGVNGSFAVTAVNAGAKTFSVSVPATPTGTYNNAVDTTDTWTRVAPHNTTGMVKRIYRTVTGASGATTYNLVAEIAVATTSYNDTLSETLAAQGAVLATDDWLAPPADLHHLIGLPNGMMAGLSGNVLCFSEPYRPHAWPSAYQRTLRFAGRALGAFGTTLVVLTEDWPYVVTATSPDAISETAIQSHDYHCLATRAVLSTEYGVMFPVALGLALIGPDGHSIVTRELASAREWATFNPPSWVSAWYQGRYYAAYTTLDGLHGGILVYDRAEGILSTVNLRCDTLYRDDLDGALYVLLDNLVQQWEGDVGRRLSVDWLSKEFVFPAPINLGAAKVDFDTGASAAEEAAAQSAYDATRAANAALIAARGLRGALNASALNVRATNASAAAPLPDTAWGRLTFTLYANGAPVASRVVRNQNAFHLPAGYSADTASVRVAGNVRVKAVLFAETLTGLAQA